MAQQIKLSGHFTAKNAFLPLLAVKWPFVRQNIYLLEFPSNSTHLLLVGDDGTIGHSERSRLQFGKFLQVSMMPSAIFMLWYNLREKQVNVHNE